MRRFTSRALSKPYKYAANTAALPFASICSGGNPSVMRRPALACGMCTAVVACSRCCFATRVSKTERNIPVGFPLPSSSSSLPQQQKQQQQQPLYTIVFDMDETLLYGCGDLSNPDVRPHAVDTIKLCKKHCPTFQKKRAEAEKSTQEEKEEEAARKTTSDTTADQEQHRIELILWTAAVQWYAEHAMIKMMRGAEEVLKHFDYLIYRDNPEGWDTTGHKDLRILGRDLKRTVIVENSECSCWLNPHNALMVRDYNGKHATKEGVNDLIVVKEVLNDMLKEKPDDVRVFLKEHKHRHIVLDVKLDERKRKHKSKRTKAQK